jgi:teichuronic acid biosynthesis glycosyltransferase TuaC
MTGSPRVLFVTNMWPDDVRPWYGTFVKVQAEGLRRLGLQIDVLTIPGYRSRGAYLAAAAQVAALNRRPRFDVVHAHYGHAGVVARLQIRAPLVVTFYGSDLLGVPRESGGLTRRSRVEAHVFAQLARAVAATITNSEQMERALPEACRRRNHVIPNGVDVDRFRPRDRADARRRLGWPQDERTVLFVGDPRLVVKNHRLAEAVWRRAAGVLPDLALRVATGLPPTEIPLWMSAADALLVTSRSEGSPNVVKEAMAAELPIVSTPVGDVPERLRGLPGCFVREPDAGALADALLGALRHGRVPEAREAITALSAERVAGRVAQVYERVGASSRPRRPLFQRATPDHRRSGVHRLSPRR